MKIDLVNLVEEVSTQENIHGGIYKIFALTCLQKLVDMKEEDTTVTHCCTEFICHSCNEKKSGQNDGQIHEVCKDCFSSI